MRKHTAISKHDLKVYEDYKSGEVITYFLSPEELGKYKNLNAPERAKISFHIFPNKK